MNALIAAMAEAMSEDPTYAWIITENHLGDNEGVGVTGPRRAPDELTARLHAPSTNMQLAAGLSRWRFRLYDDDGQLYYSGVLVTTELTPDDDDTGPNGALAAPLYDFGMPNAGCTRITWDGHPEWEIG